MGIEWKLERGGGVAIIKVRSNTSMNGRFKSDFREIGAKIIKVTKKKLRLLSHRFKQVIIHTVYIYV